MSNKKKEKTIVFHGEVIGGKIPEYMYDAIMPFILSAIREMWEEDQRKKTHSVGYCFESFNDSKYFTNIFLIFGRINCRLVSLSNGLALIFTL